MAYQIKWTEIAVEDFENVIVYLLNNWSLNVANDFSQILQKKLIILSHHPHIGIASINFLSVRSVSITKHNRLFYRITGYTIELLNLFDNRQNPEINAYKNS